MMTKSFVAAGFWCASLLSLSLAVRARGQGEPTAAEILERMAKVYAGCTTYRDSGIVTRVFFEERGKRTDRKSFTTAFIRPDRIRHELKSRKGEEEFDRHLVWSEGQDVRTWCDVRPGVTTSETLKRAIGPVSIGGSPVPTMLLDGDGGRGSRLLRDAFQVEDAVIDGSECYRISGTDGGEPRSIWVDKTSWLLRRIEEETQLPGFRTETVTEFEPAVDVPIPESLLVFDPPDQEDEDAQGPVLSPPLAPSARQWKPTAEQILADMARTYAECKTYKDSGVVTTVFFAERGKFTVRKPFTTAFIRPGRFRYEFKARRGEEEFDRYLIWQEWPEVRTWWDVRPGIETGKSLQDAIAGATGVSGGSSQTVPGYLMPDHVRAWILPNLRELERMEDASIGTLDCYRIMGTRDAGRGDLMVLWIDKQSLLLRRIEEWNQFEDFRTEEVTDYEPEIDLPIPESLLVFDPPEPEDR